MKIKIITLAFFFTALLSNTFAQINFVWGSFGGINLVCEGWAVTTDKNSNIFLTGECAGGFSFVFGGNSLKLIGGGWNDYLVKLDANGSSKWVRGANLVGANSTSTGIAIATDKNGEICETGIFSGRIEFGTNKLVFDSSGGSTNCYLVKYDSMGNALWATSPIARVSYIGPNWVSNCGLAVTTDEYNNVYLAGTFTDTIVFGNIKLIDVTNTNQCAMFLVKYDQNGNVLWANSYGINSSAWDYEGLSLAVDRDDHIYFAGGFDGPSISFGQKVLTCIGRAIFLTKFDLNGNVLWAESAGGTNLDYANKVVIDKSNNVYIDGTITSPLVTFGTQTLTCPYAGNEFFIAKYDTGGNVLWAKAADNHSVGYSVAVDSCNDVFASGGCPGVISVDSSVFSVGNGATDPTFVLKFDYTGVILAGGVIKSGGDDNNDIATDNQGNVIMGGDFQGTMVIGKDTTSTAPNLEMAGVLKFSLGLNCCIENKGENACCNTTLYAGQSTGIGISPLNDSTSYFWWPSQGLNCQTCSSVVVTPSVTTTYYVTTLSGKDSNCVTDAVTITIEPPCKDFAVPNVFTPNGDGLNDKFLINAIGMSDYAIDIYDRWGIKEFHADTPTISWDGTDLRGNKVPLGAVEGL
ncbi:MAG: gliding motility-associated C-terminal domain-containing protein [Bacteroidia bacterium]